MPDRPSPATRTIGFGLQLLALTLLLSAAVKYGGTYLPISPISSVAIAIVLTPAIVVAIILAVLQSR
jgi:hypothetical protein